MPKHPPGVALPCRIGIEKWFLSEGRRVLAAGDVDLRTLCKDEAASEVPTVEGVELLRCRAMPFGEIAKGDLLGDKDG